MNKIHKSRLDWVKSISKEELEKRFKEAKILAETAKNKISFYEEELERRASLDVPLGVPIINVRPHKTLYWLNGAGVPWEQKTNLAQDIQLRQWSFLNVFHSEESAQKHAEMLLEWRKALVANAKGEPIDIKVLLPLLPKGWVWMQDDRRWYWSKEKPEIFSNAWRIWNDGYYTSIFAFNLKPAENWRNSLMECGL